MWTTKKDLKKKIYELECFIKEQYEQIESSNRKINELTYELDAFEETYPLDLGETVYDVQLRNINGRFTKTKPARSKCVINEVEVTIKNYFNLVERYNNKDVFMCYDDACAYLDSVCVE